MSFLKITDPSKRAIIVDEYLKLKKSIQQNSLSEKLGDSDLQRDLIKLYKPITESQAGIAKELSDTSTALKALPASISSSLQAIMPADPIIPEFSQHPSIEAFQDPQIQEYGALAAKYLRLYASIKKVVDTTFGIYSRNNREHIGTLPITIHGDDVTVDEKTYTGTPGLWELLTKKIPENYGSDDLENYANILVKTKAMRKSSEQPNCPKSNKGPKYNNIIKQLLVKTKSGTTCIAPGTVISLPAPETTGEGVAAPIILPGDPNALVERLNLLIAAYKAGNTGAADESIAICDALVNQGVIDKETYKVFMKQLSRC